MKDKVSLIIPVYNVEPWLNKCIDSILCQTYRNLEVILIDDGSTDNSGKICDEYRKKDSRILVIHNKNSGLSHSRNIGIKESTGKYIMFLDSDDYIMDNNVVNKFVNMLNEDNSDFIYTSYCRFNDSNDDKVTEILPLNIEKSEVKGKNGVNILALLLQKNSYHHAAYLKICRKDFLIKYNLFFKEGVYHEDAEWTPKLFYYTNKMSIYTEPYYMRRMRENSIITSKNENNITKKICDRLIIAKELIDFFDKVEKSDCKDIIINDFVRMYWGDLISISSIKSNANLQKCMQTLKDTKSVLSYANNKKYIIAKNIINIIGCENFIGVLSKLA